MCWPTYRGAAYFASSIFIYRGIQVVFTLFSSIITGLKAMYLPISDAEEYLLQLIYFIALFTSASFALLGVESNSHNFILFSTLALSFTLLLRYCAEVAYIYLVNWEAYHLKLVPICFNICFDLFLVLVLLVYLRHKRKIKQDILLDLIEQQEKKENVVKVSDDSTIVRQPITLQRVELRPVGVGIGQGFGEGVAIHYPYSRPTDMRRLERPLPPIPTSYKSSKSPSVVSSDYGSIPSTVLPPCPPKYNAPIATTDYDDL